MKILVTGMEGQVARSLVERAKLRPGIELVACGRPHLDLEQPGSAAAAIARAAPDIVINAAAYTAVDLAEGEPERAFRINADAAMRFSVGAVNVRTGNFVYFDTETHTIRPEHVMASGSLPPGFPAVEIEGEFYWDGGLISNTPLQWVVEHVEIERRRSI